MGNFITSGTFQLDKNKPSPISVSANSDIPKRPKEVLWDNSFKTCKSDADCTIFSYGCYGTLATNKESISRFERSWYQWQGDPRARSCERIQEDPNPVFLTLPSAHCINSQCEILQLQLRKP